MRVSDHKPRFSPSALLLAAYVALNVSPAPAVSGEEVSGEAVKLAGSDASAHAMTEISSAAVESHHDTLTSEVVPLEEGFIECAARAFTESDLVFARSFSNAPFLPVAFLGGTHYGDATVSEEGATPETAGQRYQVSSTSQYAGVPFLLSKRSMAVLGEYVSYADFSVEDGEDFSVTSASIAAGYLYQVDPDWQVIAALVPFYNHSSLGERGKDFWQVMGGAVARYTHNDRLWWLFGVVFELRLWHHLAPLRGRLADPHRAVERERHPALAAADVCPEQGLVRVAGRLVLGQQLGRKQHHRRRRFELEWI